MLLTHINYYKIVIIVLLYIAVNQMFDKFLYILNN